MSEGANYPPTAVRNQIKDLVDRIAYARELSIVAGVKSELLELYDNVEDELIKLKNIIEINDFSTEYANQLAKDLDKLLGAFPRYGVGDYKPVALQDEEKEIHKRQQERDHPAIENALVKFRTTFYFFSKLDFLNRDLVIVGANGSGKTFLANNLMTHVKDKGIIVSAQRILVIPHFSSVKAHVVAIDELNSIQIADKSNKTTDLTFLQNEFGILIQYLLSDNIEFLKEYRKNTQKNKRSERHLNVSKLERILELWNSIFQFPQIFEDGVNISVRANELSYSVSQMSEGEKVALFLLAQVILAPENGFVIVDEPEMYFHPSIHKRLWDQLEVERPDTTFIYITHDLEFATSRSLAKKLWLRSFQHPSGFELEEIPDNDIPQALLLELLGSRRDILFCEGEVSSLDEQIYGILFPNYTVKPVGGCLSVIHLTKAFNKLPMSSRRAIGIIDRDFISQPRLESLQQENVFAIALPEAENLLLDEAVLSTLQTELSKNENQVQKTKGDILKKLEMERDLEIAKYVSAKVDHYFKDSNVSSGKNLETLKSNYEDFTKKVDIERWGQERGAEIDKVISNMDYYGAIKIFKNKGLAAIANANFGIKDYNQKAISLLQTKIRLQDQLRKHLPNIPL